ncbi:MAG: hypothetical protein NC251_00340 [Lachnoclostridium sp.]|nr:hypothetical protein [Lachnospira sp.]MCM1246865.1 hypothetical protein [Lachnoclostridium sp.]MCM1534727.1 hypothetical protein [Clostridium sp.]
MDIKNRIKKVAAVSACVIAAVFFSGCGTPPEIDASAYVKIWLDCVFMNETPAGIKDQTAAYEKQINSITSSFLANYSENYEITPELEEDFREIFKELYAKAKYTVGDFRKREDGSYVVAVTCEQAQFYKAYEGEYKKACVDLYKNWTQFPASAPSSEADAQKYVMGMLRDSMKKGMSHIEYEEPVEISVTVEPKGGQYQISDGDVYLIFMRLFDIFDITK